MEPKKYEYIDSLRGIAILLVILTHIRKNLQFFPDIVNQFTLDGRLGVQLFFIVSAFTLTMSYNSRINETNKTRNFFIRRFFRIAPIFYLAIIFASIDIIFGYNLYAYGDRHHDLTFFEVITSLLFVNGFIPQYINSLVPGGWSIAVEFTFYFFLPFICSKIKNLNSSILFASISLLFSSIFGKIVNTILINDITGFPYFNIIQQLPIFALGIMVYWILNDKQKTIKPVTILICAITVLFYCYFLIPYHFVYSLFFVLLLLALATKPYKIFSNKIFANIGKVSFSMYLTHFIFVNMLKGKELMAVTDMQSATINLIIQYLIVFICSYLMSQLTYKFIEVPGQNLGRKIITNLNQQKTIS